MLHRHLGHLVESVLDVAVPGSHRHECEDHDDDGGQQCPLEPGSTTLFLLPSPLATGWLDPEIGKDGRRQRGELGAATVCELLVR